MRKIDYETIRAKLIAEYRDHPNPENDAITRLEARGAEVIADLCVFVMQQEGEDVGEVVDALMAIICIPLENVIQNCVPVEYQHICYERAKDAFAFYLSGDGTSSEGTPVPIVRKDVGDA